MIKQSISDRYKVDPYGTEEIVSSASNSCAPILTIDYGDEVQTDAEFTIRPTKGSLDTNISDVAIVGPIKGNTIAWNQRASFGAASPVVKGGITFTLNSDNSVSISGSDSTTYRDYDNIFGMASIDHKVIIYGKIGIGLRIGRTNGTYLGMVEGGIPGIFNAADGIAVTVRAYANTTYSDFMLYPMLIDLTLIYGAGNEPSTVEAFEADYYKWFGKQLTYEPYSAGSLRNCKMSGIKATGFNQWDEKREGGSIDSQTGQPALGTDYFRSKNYISVIPNTKYCITAFDSPASSFFYIFEYREDKSFIKASAYLFANVVNKYTVSIETAFIKFNVYKNGSGWITNVPDFEIIINLSSSKDGQYEPYRPSFCNIPVTSLKGKLNGQGSSVVVFPDGMKKVGSVYDEIKKENNKIKAIKRIGSRAYQSGDESDNTVLTDGSTTTFYVLSTPEEYILDALDVQKMMLGTNEVQKVYLGSDVIFQS